MDSRPLDLRTAPGSRRHPHLARDQLAGWLPAAGIAYRWEPRLGGFREPAPDSPDTVWKNTSFPRLRRPSAHARCVRRGGDVLVCDGAG